MCIGVKRGFPVGTSGKESACQRRRQRLNPWVRRILWRRRWQPTPVFLPGKFHGQRSLTGYSPWGHEEADMSEPLSTHTGEKRGTAGREERKAGGDSRQLQMVLQRIRINCQLFHTTVLGYRSVSAEQPPYTLQVPFCIKRTVTLSNSYHLFQKLSLWENYMSYKYSILGAITPDLSLKKKRKW